MTNTFKRSITCIIAAMLFGFAAVGTAAEPPRILIIGLDLSQSNLLVSNQDFAAKAADKVRHIVSALPPRSRVLLRTLGSYDFRQNTISAEWEIGLKTTRAAYIAEIVAQKIEGIPQDVRSRRLPTQRETNIVAFLQNMSAAFDCNEMTVSIVLVSDGVEDSKIADLSRKRATLPIQQSAAFAGCGELTMLGLGQGLDSPVDTERLRGEWTTWAKTSGFRRFAGLNDW